MTHEGNVVLNAPLVPLYSRMISRLHYFRHDYIASFLPASITMCMYLFLLFVCTNLNSL